MWLSNDANDLIQSLHFGKKVKFENIQNVLSLVFIQGS